MFYRFYSYLVSSVIVSSWLDLVLGSDYVLVVLLIFPRSPLCPLHENDDRSRGATERSRDPQITRHSQSGVE